MRKIGFDLEASHDYHISRFPKGSVGWQAVRIQQVVFGCGLLAGSGKGLIYREIEREHNSGAEHAAEKRRI